MSDIMWMVVLLVLHTTITTHAQNSEYCAITRQHTMCRNKGVGQLCHQLGERGLSSREQEEVTDYHNRLRSRVAQGITSQPPASNMLSLHWDSELARIAQRLADQCKFSHDCSDCRRVTRFKVGQNLYQSFTTKTGETVNWQSAIDSWFQEIDLFPVSSVTNYRFSAKTGHYSQMVWAETDRIGCGVTQYRKGRFNARLYVCNYGSTGNIVRRSVYKTGAPCSNCPCSTQCSPHYPALCAPSNSTASACCDNLFCMLTRPDIITNEITDLAVETVGGAAMETVHGAMNTAHGVGHVAMNTAHGVGNLAMQGAHGVGSLAMQGAHQVGSLAMNTMHGVGSLAMQGAHGVGQAAHGVGSLGSEVTRLVGRGFRPVTDLVNQGVDFQRQTFQQLLGNNFFGKK